MKVFLDANILVVVLNREYPLYTHAAQVMSLADDQGYELYVSPLTIAIAFYFSCKKSGEKMAKQKISLMLKHVQVAATDASAVKRSLQKASVEDLEDGMQYFTAVDAGCQVILTEDLGDFYFSDLPVMSAEEFLRRRAAN